MLPKTTRFFSWKPKKYSKNIATDSKDRGGAEITEALRPCGCAFGGIWSREQQYCLASIDPSRGEVLLVKGENKREGERAREREDGRANSGGEERG